MPPTYKHSYKNIMSPGNMQFRLRIDSLTELSPTNNSLLIYCFQFISPVVHVS